MLVLRNLHFVNNKKSFIEKSLALLLRAKHKRKKGLRAAPPV